MDRRPPNLSDAGLTRFAPPSLCRALRADALAPPSESFDAAVLFADVSGFSALASRMAEKGASGAEELTSHLNHSFGAMLRLVRSFGGEVEKFAGDALLAVFRCNADPAQQAGLGQAVARAAACGQAITAAINGQQADAEAIAVHVGVGAGTVATLHVALDDNDRSFVLLGEPFVQMAQAAARAGPGEVRLSSAARRLLPPAPVAIAGAMADAALPPALPGSAVAPYLNRALRERIAALGDAAWIAELRRTTVVFVHLGAIPEDVDRSGASIARLAALVGAHVARFQGLLHDLVADDKGLVAIVVFGLRQANEDDAGRAVRMALELHAALHAGGTAASIGVATGRVYCGVIGDGHRAELAVTGESVNLAAHLMAAADGGILCAPETASDAGRWCSFEVVDGLLLKNRSRSVQAHRPSAARAAAVPGPAPHRGALVGRARESAELARVLDSFLRQPAFAALVLEGEAGIGKSALLEHLAQRAQQAGARVLQIGGSAIDQTILYYACRAMVADLLGVDLQAEPAAQQAQIAQRLAAFDDVAAFAPLLGAILPAAPAMTARMLALDAQARAQALLDLLLALLSDAAAAAPMVLVVEDAHWLDSASWALLLQLARRALPVCLYLSVRTAAHAQEAPAAPLASLLRLAGVGTLALAPLDARDSGDLICARLGVATLSPGVQALLHEHTTGHPLFMEHLALALRDGGLVRVEGDTCVLAPGAPDQAALVIPDTLERLLTSRIDRLGESQRLVLKVASVLGRSFSFEALEAVYPVASERAELAEQLAQLCAGDFLDAGGDEQFRFRHAVLCDVAYALLPFAQRRDLHQAVARDVVRRHPEQPWRKAAYLAHHWGRAQVHDQAMLAAEQAGRQAVERFANREVLHFFGDALRSNAALGNPTPPATLALWHFWMGRAHRELGELGQARARLEAALTLLGCPLPSKRPWPRMRLAALVLRMFAGKPVVGEPPPRQHESVTAVDAYNMLAVLWHYENDIEAFFFCNAHAFARAPQAAPSAAVAALYGSLAHLAAFGKRFAAAQRYRDAAHVVARSVGTPLCIATAHQYTGHLAGCLGELQLLEHDMQQALALYGEVGMGRLWEEAQVNLGFLYQLQGRPALALQAVEQLERSGRARDDNQTTTWGVMGKARLELVQGRTAAALEQLARAQVPDNDGLALTDLLGTRLLARVRTGALDAARADAATALEHVEKTASTTYTVLPAYASTMEALVLLWLAAPADAVARDRVERMLRVLGRFAGLFPVAAAQHAIWTAVVADLRARPKAARLRDAALARARASQVKADEATALRWFARTQHGPQRRATLEQVVALFAAIGQHFEANEARAWLDGAPPDTVPTPWKEFP